MSKSLRHNNARPGITAIWMVSGLALLIAIASIAVDYGRVQIAKTELRRATDAAARAGAAGLGNTTLAISLAKQYAAANTVDGTGLILADSDIDIGTWDDVHRSFTVLTGANRTYGNAIRINAKRTAAAGTPINLMFGKVFGINSTDLTASAIACQSPMEWAVVGLDHVTMSGNSSASYWTNGSGQTANGGNIGSNGDITLSGTSSIRGNVHPGVGRSKLGGGTVYGVVSNLISPLSFPNGSAAPYNATNNDNALLGAALNPSNKNLTLGNGVHNIAAGNYVLNTFSLGANGTLNLQGPVTFFVYGDFVLSGQAITNNNLAKNLTIVMIPHPNTGAAPGTMSIGSGSALYAKIYAPQSPLTMSGNGAFYGSIVAKSVTMTGGSSINYDASLGGNGGIALVK